jgi:hypothetical protein
MKSLKSILFAAVLLISATSHGQDKSFQMGIKGGLNLFYITNPPIGFTSNLSIGFHAGLCSSINFDSSNFSIRPELLFNNVGANVENYVYANYSSISQNHNTSIHTQYKITSNYIQLPLLLKYQFARGISVLIGPYFSYLLSAKNDSSSFISFKDSANSPNSAATDSTGSATLNILNSMNKLDIGAALGFSYETSKGLGFEIRYSFGITSAFKSANYINPSSKITTFQPAYGNNNNIALSIYYLF